MKEIFKVCNMLRNGTDDDECIIRILENGTREVIDEGV